MQIGEVLQILIEFGIVYLFFLLFFLVGKIFLKRFEALAYGSTSSPYGRLFWCFIAGLFVVISLYSIVVSKGRTINILVLPLLYFLFRKNDKAMPSDDLKAEPFTYTLFLEVGFIALLSILTLHLFPESEYKQADSFFYLKIAESLNATGQENISHYNNLYSSGFHGLEPYHYFEIWITAFITRFTEGFMPSIWAERFIAHGILLTGIIVGLYYLTAEFSRQKIRAVQKIFCWSLLFILPNVLSFFPWLYHIFISDFEGNLLERPNFRIIYLLLIPVIIQLQVYGVLTKRSIYLLLLLCVVSFKCTVVVIPSLLLYGVLLVIKKDPSHRVIWFSTIVFSLVFAALYMLFPADGVPSLYTADLSTFLRQTLHSWKFILFSIATSTVYLIILALLFLLPLFIVYGKALLTNIKRFLLPFGVLIIIGATGLLMARILYLKDNAYQFLFITHILVTLFVWLVYLVVLPINNKSRSYFFAAIFLSLLWLLRPLTTHEKQVNTFVQNGNYIYGGVKYSAGYLNEVRDYFKQNKPIVGGYIADTNFYKATYYSRRNPNVYFLPLTYIIANDYNRNFEFCLSDTAAINYEVDNPLYRDYLNNAINRSYFYQYGLKYPGFTHIQLIKKFIADNHLSYLIVTKDFPIGDLKSLLKKQTLDPNTGERFLIIE